MLMDLATARSYLPLLMEGGARTLWLTAATLVGGFLISVPVAWCRNSRFRFARAFAVTYVFVFRGAPLLVLLFLIYYGASDVPFVRGTFLWTAFREPVFCAVLALSLNSSGYLSEILAGAVRQVPRTEVEAALVAGLSPAATLRHVILPNAARIGLRAYGNEVTFVIKGTSAASLVTIMELMASANQVYYNTFDPITPLLAAGLLYLLLVFVVTRAVAVMEVRLSPELRRRVQAKRVVAPRAPLRSGMP